LEPEEIKFYIILLKTPCRNNLTSRQQKIELDDCFFFSVEKISQPVLFLNLKAKFSLQYFNTQLIYYYGTGGSKNKIFLIASGNCARVCGAVELFVRKFNCAMTIEF